MQRTQRKKRRSRRRGEQAGGRARAAARMRAWLPPLLSSLRTHLLVYAAEVESLQLNQVGLVSVGRPEGGVVTILSLGTRSQVPGESLTAAEGAGDAGIQLLLYYYYTTTTTGYWASACVRMALRGMRFLRVRLAEIVFCAL